MLLVGWLLPCMCDQANVLKMLTVLQVCMHTCAELIASVPFLEDAEEGFVRYLVTQLHPTVCTTAHCLHHFSLPAMPVSDLCIIAHCSLVLYCKTLACAACMHALTAIKVKLARHFSLLLSADLWLMETCRPALHHTCLVSLALCVPRLNSRAFVRNPVPARLILYRCT